MKFDKLKQEIDNETISEVLNENIELKSNWHQDYGKTISAFANKISEEQCFLLIGIADDGTILGRGYAWLVETEKKVSNHIHQYLSPFGAVEIVGYETSKGYVLVVIVESPNDIAEWNGKAYKRIGTNTVEMSPDEKLNLILSLPGQDYSKRAWSGEISGSLVLEFAKKLAERKYAGLPEDISSLSPKEILNKIGAFGKMAANILFGNCPIRVAYYDESGDVINQTTKIGAFSILTSDFIEHIQNSTKSKGTVLEKGSISAIEMLPYPVKSLREALANAVAHALYERNDGEILVEIYPSRISIKNNCVLEVKRFSKEWFSKKSYTKNKFLMHLLREAGFTDELGSGKTRMFSQILEAGKKEPIIEFYEKGHYGCWGVVLYSEFEKESYTLLLKKLHQNFTIPDEARLALALVIWRQKSWIKIQEKLDTHYLGLAKEITQKNESPILIVENSIFCKRWAKVIIQGNVSAMFNSEEEEQIKIAIREFAFSREPKGIINVELAKNRIGLSGSKSEAAYLSNLFRKWRDQGILEKTAKRGEWKFLCFNKKKEQ